MEFWYDFATSVVRFYTTFFLHYQVKGRERIPPGPKIIVGNHPCATDSFVLPFIFKEKLHFAIQADIFDIAIVGRLLTLAGQIPVVVGQGHEMVKAGVRWLEKGHDIVIFPEGRLNYGKDFHRAGSGAALLALQTGAPVLPIGIWSPPKFIRRIQSNVLNRPTDGGWQIGGKVFINIGDPLFLAKPVDSTRIYRHLRECTNQIMSQVSELVQQIQQPPESNPPLSPPVSS